MSLTPSEQAATDRIHRLTLEAFQRSVGDLHVMQVNFQRAVDAHTLLLGNLHHRLRRVERQTGVEPPTHVLNRVDVLLASATDGQPSP